MITGELAKAKYLPDLLEVSVNGKWMTVRMDRVFGKIYREGKEGKVETLVTLATYLAKGRGLELDYVKDTAA